MAKRKQQIAKLEHSLFTEAAKRERLRPPTKLPPFNALPGQFYQVHWEKHGTTFATIAGRTMRDVETLKREIESGGGKFLMYGVVYE